MQGLQGESTLALLGWATPQPKNQLQGPCSLAMAERSSVRPLDWARQLAGAPDTPFGPAEIPALNLRAIQHVRREQ